MTAARSHAIILTLLAFILAVSLVPAASANTVTVDMNGQGDYGSLFLGLYWSGPGDTVLVYPGEYTGSNNRELTFPAHDLVLMSRDGPEATTLNLEGHLGILIDSYQTSATVVDGFTFTGTDGDYGDYAMRIEDFAACTIRNCVFYESAPVEMAGAATRVVESCEFIRNRDGLEVVDWSDVSVRDCTFRNNHRALTLSGAYVASTTVTVTDCEFDSNTTSVSIRTSGVVLVDGCSFTNSTPGQYSFTSGTSLKLITYSPAHATVSDCSFSDNRSSHSAGAVDVDVRGGYAELTNCVFADNAAEDTGGAVTCEGDDITLSGCQFLRNSAGVGGAVRVYASGTTGEVSIVDCIFEENEAVDGGAIATAHWKTSVSGGEFLGNTAERGGALFGEEGLTDMVGCLITGNTAHMWGGGACLMNTRRTPGNRIEGCTFERNRSHRGGVLLADRSLGKLTKCTLFGNSSDDASVVATRAAQVYLERTITSFASSGAPVAVQMQSTAYITNCAVFGNAGGDSLGGYLVFPTDNLFTDPLFCDISSSDYSVCTNSPCLPDNNPWTVQIGDHGEGCGVCATPVERTSWGAIKAMYR